jgi:DNA primase
MSMMQQNLIARTWAGKPVFLMLDNDAKAEMAQAKELLARQSLQVIPIDLPDERDPADYSFNEITELFMARAAEAGVLHAFV